MNEPILVVIKPDGLIKSLTGNILTRLSETKLEIVAAKIVRVSERLAKEHYRHMQDKPFFSELVKYIKGELHDRCKVLAMIYYGEGAIKKVRELAGATNPEDANSITIRGQYGRITTKGVYENVIHASSNVQEAEREIKLWFEPEEIIVDLYPSKVVSQQIKQKTWV